MTDTGERTEAPVTRPASDPGRSRPTRGTHALRHMASRRDFRRLFLARIAAQWSDGIFQASLAGAVLFNPQHAADPADLAASFAVLLLPYSLVGPFAGVVLDRNSRARVMFWANLARAGVVLGVAALVWAGVQSAPFYLMALLALSLSRFFLSGLSASLPHVVDRADLVSANAVTTTLGTVAGIVGGITALGVRLLAGTGNHGYGVIAATAAVGYLLAAWAVSTFGSDALGPTAEDRRIHTSAREIAVGMVQGAKHLAERRPTAVALTAVSVHRLLFGVLTVGILLLFRQYVEADGFLRNGLAGVGQALGFGGAGALLAAAVTPALVRRLGKPTWAALALGAGGGLAFALFVPMLPWLFLAGAFVIGFAGQAVKVCTDTVVQETMEESFRGRVFAVYDTLFNVTFVVGIVAASFLMPDDGRAPLLFAGCALVYLLTGVGYHWLARRYDFPV